MQAIFNLEGKYDARGELTPRDPFHGKVWAVAFTVAALATVLLAVVGVGAVCLGAYALANISITLGLLQLSTGVLILCAGLPWLIQIAINNLIHAKHHLSDEPESTSTTQTISSSLESATSLTIQLDSFPSATEATPLLIQTTSITPANEPQQPQQPVPTQTPLDSHQEYLEKKAKTSLIEQPKNENVSAKTIGSMPLSTAQQPQSSLNLAIHQQIFETFERKDYKRLTQLLYKANPLLKRDAKLAARFKQEKWERLQLAVILGRLDEVRKFYKQSADAIDLQDSIGRSLLMIGAGWEGHVEVMKWLVRKKGSLLQSLDNRGNTPLHWAAHYGHPEAVQWLVKKDNGASLKQENMQGWTPLHVAAREGHLEVVKLLVLKDNGASLKQENVQGRTPLHEAAFNGHHDVFSWLVDQNEGLLELTDKKGRTPLHLAARKGYFKIFNSLDDKWNSVLRIEDNEGDIPLHAAACKGDQDVVEVLIRKDPASLRIVGKGKLSPLHMASFHGHLEVVKLIINEDPSLLFLEDSLGNTPLHIASFAGKNRVVELLCDQVLQQDAKKSILQRIATIRRIPPLKKGNNAGLTALHLAAQRGHLAVVQLLADKDRNLLQITDITGQTAANVARTANHTAVADLLDNFTT